MEIKRYGVNNRMSAAVTYNRLLFLSGKIDNREQKGLNLKEQAAFVLHRIENDLLEQGSDKTNLLSAMIHLQDISQIAEINEVWDSWIGVGNGPARTCVEAKMVSNEIFVEITVVAAIPEQSE